MGFIQRILSKIGIGRKKSLRVVLCGPPNAGKSMLTNRIYKKWTGEHAGQVSSAPHETETVEEYNGINMNFNGKKMNISVLDTPGLATRISYEDFMKHGIAEEEAKQRARNAARGVIEAVRTIQEADVVLVVLDSTHDPLTQVNITLLANLDVKGIPTIIIANKTDLKRSNVNRIINAFPDHHVIGVSAKNGDNIDLIYESLARM